MYSNNVDAALTLTELETGARITLRVSAITYFSEFSEYFAVTDKKLEGTKIMVGGHYILVREKYDDIEKLISPRVTRMQTK